MTDSFKNTSIESLISSETTSRILSETLVFIKIFFICINEIFNPRLVHLQIHTLFLFLRKNVHFDTNISNGRNCILKQNLFPKLWIEFHSFNASHHHYRKIEHFLFLIVVFARFWLDNEIIYSFERRRLLKTQ